MSATEYYKEQVRELKNSLLKGQYICDVSEYLCTKNDEKVLSVTVDSKIRIYTHYSDFDSGYVVGIFYMFQKTDGKFIGVKVI